jgi:hypothetical protein
MKMPPVALILLTLHLNYSAHSSHRLKFTMPQSKEDTSATDEIPTVAFCDLVKNPSTYFDKTVRLTAIFSQAEEGQYLSHNDCPLSHDEQIGVGYAESNKAAVDVFNKNISLIHSPEYGGKGIVTVVGMLRNSSRRDFAWYHYRFDIIRFESVSHVTVPYEGDLQVGTSYVAIANTDSSLGPRLPVPVRMPMHYATRVEWINLAEFPELKANSKSSKKRQIVFSVISDEIQQMTATRWNRTIRCKIISMDKQ